MRFEDRLVKGEFQGLFYTDDIILVERTWDEVNAEQECQREKNKKSLN